MEKYDPTTQKWSSAASMTTRRSSVGVGVLNGLIYAVIIKFELAFKLSVIHLDVHFRLEATMGLRGNVYPQLNATLLKRIRGHQLATWLEN